MSKCQEKEAILKMSEVVPRRILDLAIQPNSPTQSRIEKTQNLKQRPKDQVKSKENHHQLLLLIAKVLVVTLLPQEEARLNPPKKPSLLINSITTTPKHTETIWTNLAKKNLLHPFITVNQVETTIMGREKSRRGSVAQTQA